VPPASASALRKVKVIDVADPRVTRRLAGFRSIGSLGTARQRRPGRKIIRVRRTALREDLAPRRAGGEALSAINGSETTRVVDEFVRR